MSLGNSCNMQMTLNLTAIAKNKIKFKNKFILLLIVALRANWTKIMYFREIKDNVRKTVSVA